MSRKLPVFVLLLLFAGCSSSLEYMKRTNENYSANRGPSEIEVLYEYPPEQEIKTLGMIEYDYYNPGLEAPDMNGALPKIRERASAEGGDAVVIRKEEISKQNTRMLQVKAEVIRYAN